MALPEAWKDLHRWTGRYKAHRLSPTAMRQLLIIAVCLSFAGCATTTSTEMSTRPACDLRSRCFNQRSVRDFRMLDRDTILVEVGANRCPYVVEVDGIFCDLRFASTIAFQDRGGRICSAGRSYITSGPFARGPEDVCRVRDVRGISDDELLERNAAAGRIPPLPPTGSGQLEVEVEDLVKATSTDTSPPEGQGDEGVAPAAVMP
jgi:hypothetical protein